MQRSLILRGHERGICKYDSADSIKIQTIATNKRVINQTREDSGNVFKGDVSIKMNPNDPGYPDKKQERAINQPCFFDGLCNVDQEGEVVWAPKSRPSVNSCTATASAISRSG